MFYIKKVCIYGVITVKNKKRLFLNISFCVIIVLTIVLHTMEYFYYKNELEIAREIAGDGYYVHELFMMVVPISLLISVIIETSIYFNLRYFIIENNKTTLKTVFNVILLICALALYIFGFVLENCIDFECFLVFISLLLVLRIVYIFIKKNC